MRRLRFDSLVFVICAFVSVFQCIFSFSDISIKDSNNLNAMDHNSLNSAQRNFTENDFKQFYSDADKVPVGCKKLRSKRYFSDGDCYSAKPIIEEVCVGSCVPVKEFDFPWWPDFLNYWSDNKQKEHRCVNDKVRRKKIQLICRDGSLRTYTVKVVKSCKCKIVNKKRKNRRGRRRNRKNKRHINNKNRNRNRNRNRRNKGRFEFKNMNT